MRGHITRASTVVAAALLIAGGAVAPAGAGVPNTTCDQAFEALSGATEAAVFTSKRSWQDKQGLLTKVDEAKDKFRMNKVADSLQKLTDYANKVSSLTAQGKVEDAAAMVTAQAAAVACVKEA